MWEEDYETLLHSLHVSSFVFLKGEGVTCEAQDEKQANIIKDLAKTNQVKQIEGFFKSFLSVP